MKKQLSYLVAAFAAGASSFADVTETKAVLDSLILEGEGTAPAVIRGGEFASSGTLALNGIVLDESCELPLVLAGTAVPDDLSGWTVTIDGVAKPKWKLAFGDGKLALRKPGFALLFR